MNWLEPWDSIDEASTEERAALERQLAIEVGSRHVLFGQKMEAMARRFDTDDVLFRMADKRVAEVHLTWRQGQAPDAFFPGTTLYASLEEWAALSMAADHEDRMSTR